MTVQAGRGVMSHRQYAAMNPYRFNNDNASSIRTIMVADVPKPGSEKSSSTPTRTSTSTWGSPQCAICMVNILAALFFFFFAFAEVGVDMLHCRCAPGICPVHTILALVFVGILLQYAGYLCVAGAVSIVFGEGWDL